LSIAQLEQLAEELRSELIETVSLHGGHFASSLGATEITLALHYVFESPKDKIVWDVGHQAYIHKMLTGRRQKMHTIRKLGGLSGFPKRSESPFDAFGVGHAGTSISAALGMAEAMEKKGEDGRAIAVIGDGSFTAGMALEAMNHAGALGRRIIVLLNDNDMSISPNVGALSWLFSRAVTSKVPTLARDRFKELYKKGYVPEFVYKTLDRAEEAAQTFVSGASSWVEAFGFRYIGPVDGHNIASVITALEHAKNQNCPVLVHVRTEKGKGFEPAEEDPVRWHATKPFKIVKNAISDIKTTESPRQKPFSTMFGEAMCELADRDDRIIGITAAMATGTGLDIFAKKHPDKFYDVAICEQHAVTYAAGLACEGYRPVCAIYSTFLQRAYDQVIHDVCIQKLPVVFAIDRAGVVGNDGHTHQGTFDIPYLRCIPDIKIMAPKDGRELRDMLYTALSLDVPSAIRFPRGKGISAEPGSQFRMLDVGKAEVLQKGKDVLLIAVGPFVFTALDVALRVRRDFGLTVTVVNARFIKPLDKALLCEEALKHRIVCTIEDGSLIGGFGSALLECFADEGVELFAPLKRFGVQDSFVPHGSQEEQYRMNGYDSDSIYSFIQSCVESRAKAIGA
ncbi:MAG: 1-deoxy-D-xylulose-5-phosphate synthase, partial [Candidatus Dadabacteria bacterium]